MYFFFAHHIKFINIIDLDWKLTTSFYWVTLLLELISRKLRIWGKSISPYWMISSLKLQCSHRLNDGWTSCLRSKIYKIRGSTRSEDHPKPWFSSADLEVQLMQLNNCDGVLSIYWNTLLGQQISQHTAISMSKSALGKTNWDSLIL